MFDIKEEEEIKPKALLVGLPENGLKELEGLVDTLGMEIIEKIIVSKAQTNPAYGIGSGKAEQIAQTAIEIGADCIIFDFEIEPTKQRNWEKLSKIPCFDRQETILRIFAQRAKTREAVLQVELASLTYSLPRLAHSYGDMSRQRGGNYGSKGSGETKLELDHRRVKERILAVKKELAKVAKSRDTQKKRRNTIPVLECALVGYTNAGKSSLMNALTGSETFVEDKLFATLDPLTRKIKLKTGGDLLLTDTVGFISRLPHNLIAAFKSTLACTQEADLLLIVIDSSDENAVSQYNTVCEVLKEIGSETQSIIVLNKIDKHSENMLGLTGLKNRFSNSVCVSAKTKEGLEELTKMISELLLGLPQKYKIPITETTLISQIKTSSIIDKEEWTDDYVKLKARLSKSVLEKALKYKVE